MKLASDKIPNKMLIGPEVLECAVQEFRAMLQRDCMFLKTIAYRRVAFTLQATFHFGSPFTVPHVVKSRTLAGEVVEGEFPLNPAPEMDDSDVLALERDVKLDNPNQARVEHDLPITVQEKAPPKQMNTSNLPGEPAAPLNPYPEIITHELRYDKTQYPAGTSPVDRDVTEKKAADMGIKRRSR